MITNVDEDVREKRSPCTLLVGTYMSKATMETSMELPQNLKI
jgi:hypothetical protein